MNHESGMLRANTASTVSAGTFRAAQMSRTAQPASSRETTASLPGAGRSLDTWTARSAASCTSAVASSATHITRPRCGSRVERSHPTLGEYSSCTSGLRAASAARSSESHDAPCGQTSVRRRPTTSRRRRWPRSSKRSVMSTISPVRDRTHPIIGSSLNISLPRSIRASTTSPRAAVSRRYHEANKGRKSLDVVGRKGVIALGRRGRR